MSPLLLTGLAVLIYLGVLQRVLDRMRLSDRAALIFIALMLVGTYLPEIPLGLVRINIGGGLVPLVLVAYLLLTADTAREKVRGLVAIGAVAATVLLLDYILPQEPGTMFIEPMYAYGIGAGIVGYGAGRSRRCAFLSAVAGVMVADIVILLQQLPLRMPQVIGGGIFGAALVAGVIAVGIAEVTGETREFVAPDHRSKVAWLDEKRRQRRRK